MYCVRGSALGINPVFPEDPVAAVRLGTEPNPQIWQDGVKALYLGKMAAGDWARKLSVATRIIIPGAHAVAAQRGLDEVRLDCLADNERLRKFYQRNFIERGEVEITNKSGSKLRLTRFASKVTL